MTADFYNCLSQKDKLYRAHYDAKKLDGFIPWSYPYRFVKIYAYHIFFIEVIFNLETGECDRVVGFSDFEYLEQYKEYTYLMERKVGWLFPLKNDEGFSDGFEWPPSKE
jgi:hypothetical protein